MKSKYTNTVPTDEEFRHAKEQMRLRDRGVSQAREQVLGEFVNSLPLHDVYIFATDESTFHVLIFLKKDSDIDLAISDGSISAICDYVARSLEQYGRGPWDTLSVVPEVDSDESVQKKFNGNYFNRMR